MELRHLRYFLAVAREENVSRAALRLHVSQPPLSRQIRQLEEELGVALFTRGPKSMRLTEAGRLFVAEAEAVLERAASAIATVRAAASGGRGTLRIGYAPSLTVEILPEILRRFEAEWPLLNVELHDLATQEMVEGLREGGLHLALVAHPGKRALAGIAFHELIRYRACIAVPPGHRLAGCKEVSIAALEGEKLVAFARAEYPEYYDWLGVLYRESVTQPAIAQEYDSATSLMAAVEAGRGIAFVREGFEVLAGRRLAIVPLEASAPPVILGIASSREDLNPSAGPFLQIARSVAEKM